MKKVIYTVTILLYYLQLSAQDTTATREEGWPELNVYYNFNDKWRIFAMYSLTKIRTSDYTDGATGLYLDYFANKSLRRKFNLMSTDSSRGYNLWLRIGYYFSTTPKNASNPVKEHTVATESNSRFHLPMFTLLTFRNRFDWRTVNREFKVRYRPRVTIEKDMQTRYLYFTPYLYGEYFANVNESNSNRFRFCIGMEVKVALYINFETYYLHQYKNGVSVDAVNAIGLALKFYLHKQAINYIFKKKNDKTTVNNYNLPFRESSLRSFGVKH